MRKSLDNDVAQLSDDIAKYLKSSPNPAQSAQEMNELISTVEQYVPDNIHEQDIVEANEGIERHINRQKAAQRSQQFDAEMEDIRELAKSGGFEPKFDTEGLSDLEIDQLYADMNPYEVFQQAVGNMGENSTEILEGLGKLVKEILPWLSLDVTVTARALYDLQQEDSMLRALGYLVLGAGYNAAHAASHAMPDPSLRTFLGSPAVKEAMKPYESVFHAMVDMYKKNYGLDGRGMIGLKRYIGEQPMDFLGDLLTFVSFATTGAAVGAKAGAISLRSSQLHQLKFHQFFTRNFRNYFNRSGKVDRIFNRLQRRMEQLHGKLPHLLDYVHEKTWYLGTGVKGGNYPPGYWATLAYYVTQYGDIGNAPFALGGEVLNVIGMAGTLSKSTPYSDELDDIATELFKKFHRDAPSSAKKSYPLEDLTYLETFGADAYLFRKYHEDGPRVPQESDAVLNAQSHIGAYADDLYTPFILGYDISHINLNNPVRFVKVGDEYMPHIYVGDDPGEFFEAYKDKGFDYSNLTENLDTPTTDKLRAEGKLRPLDELTEEELAAYRIIPQDFDLEAFILSTDKFTSRNNKLPTYRDPDITGEPEFTYQLKSNQRLVELQEDISNFFGKGVTDTDKIKQEIYQLFRDKGAESYDTLQKQLGSFARGGHNYAGVSMELLPMISYMENTMSTWEKFRFSSGWRGDKYKIDLPEDELKYLDSLFNRIEELHESGTNVTITPSSLLNQLSGKKDNWENMIANALTNDPEDVQTFYRTSVASNLDQLADMLIDHATGYATPEIRLKLELAMQQYLYANSKFLDTAKHLQTNYMLGSDQTDQLNKTIGTLRHLQELFLQKSTEFQDSKIYMELYNSITQDYYRNIRQNIQNSTAMDHPIIKHIFDQEMSKIRGELGEERFAQIYETLVENARTRESFILNTVMQKYDSLAHITDDYDRAMELLEFIANDLDIENVAFWNENVADAVHYELMDKPEIRTKVNNALQRIAERKRELVDNVRTVEDAFQQTQHAVNRDFTKFLFTALENMDNPHQARAVSRVFLDPDLIPDEAIPKLFHQVSDETMEQIRSEVAREIMQRAQTWDGLGFRIVSFEFEDIFTQISRDWELGGLIERIRTVANYPNGSDKHTDAMKVLKEYLEEIYSKRTYLDEPFDDKMIDEVVKIARKGNAGLLELLEYFQPYGGAHFIDSEINQFGHDWLHLVVGHDGVYGADNIQQGYEFWDASNNVARGQEALIVFEYTDTGGFGIDKVEKILQPTRVIGVYNPGEFYNAYRAGRNMWRNANNLRAQIRRVGEERLRLLWGDEYLESFKKFAKLSENYPLLTSGGRERVIEPVNFDQISAIEEARKAAKDPNYIPAEPAPGIDSPKFFDNLIKGLEEDKKALDKAIEEGKFPDEFEDTPEAEELLKLLEDPEEEAFLDFEATTDFDEFDDFDDIEPVDPDDWTDQAKKTSQFLGTAVDPGAPIYGALQDTGFPQLLKNTDPAIDNLELMLSTLDIEMVMKIVGSPAMIELIVKDLPPKQQAKIRTWLTIYRRAERKLYQSQKEKEEKEKKQQAARKRKSYNRSGINPGGFRLLVE